MGLQKLPQKTGYAILLKNGLAQREHYNFTVYVQIFAHVKFQQFKYENYIP